MGADQCSFRGVICGVFFVRTMYASLLVWFGRLVHTDGMG